MKLFTPEKSEWLFLDEVDSTQTVAAQQLAGDTAIGVVVAATQTKGRGRFGREWHSEKGTSLSMSVIATGYPDHQAAYLLGMELAIATAGALHAKLHWPNDVVLKGRKVGGILTEVMLDPSGRRIPIIGIGINLNQSSFPPGIADRATSLQIEFGITSDPRTVAEQILVRTKSLPEPTGWSALADIWAVFDTTPGKGYILPGGEKAIGIGVGSGGELLCSVSGESRTVLAADAILGG
jgi:BirA family biotin operon repressor/biotin-[acetyl-CoA-carboxylase] ligase